MPEISLIQKLVVKTGYRLIIVNPPEGFLSGWVNCLRTQVMLS